MEDQAQKDKLMAVCACGSEKKFGECCGKNEACYCGAMDESGKPKTAAECCMKAPEAPAAM